jgi:hypothetical protein
MQRRRRHLQFADQIHQEPRTAAEHFLDRQRTRPRPTPSAFGHETGDHARRKAARSFGRMKTLLIQALGHLCHRLALSVQLLDSSTQMRVIPQLLVALHRTYQRMLADETTRSVDGDLNLVCRAVHD